PEAALSPLKQLSLIAFILEVLKSGKAQFILATHSPILMGIPNAVLYEIKDGGMERVNYTDTDHYRITKRFVVDPESYLRHLRKGAILLVDLSGDALYECFGQEPGEGRAEFVDEAGDDFGFAGEHSAGSEVGDRFGCH